MSFKNFQDLVQFSLDAATQLKTVENKLTECSDLAQVSAKAISGNVDNTVSRVVAIEKALGIGEKIIDKTVAKTIVKLTSGLSIPNIEYIPEADFLSSILADNLIDTTKSDVIYLENDFGKDLKIGGTLNYKNFTDADLLQLSFDATNNTLTITGIQSIDSIKEQVSNVVDSITRTVPSFADFYLAIKI